MAGGVILCFAERRGNMLDQGFSDAMPPWFCLLPSSPPLGRGVGKGMRISVVSMDVIFFHWETGDYSVLLAKRNSPFANTCRCSAIQVPTLCLRNCSGYYLWLRSTTFLCVFFPLLQDPSQFIMKYHWINWQRAWFEFICLVLIHLLCCRLSLFVSSWAGRWSVAAAQDGRGRGCCCHPKVRSHLPGLGAQGLRLHMQAI